MLPGRTKGRHGRSNKYGAYPGIVCWSKYMASSDKVPRYADIFSAMGAEPGLRIMQVLLSAHPTGMVVG